MKNKVTIEICDHEYNLITEESEEYVQSLAKEIEGMIESMAYKNLRTSKLDAAMITCLDLCDKNNKLTKDNDNMRRQVTSYVDEIGSLNKQLSELERKQKHSRNNYDAEPENILEKPEAYKFTGAAHA